MSSYINDYHEDGKLQVIWSLLDAHLELALSFLHSWSWWCLEGTHYGSLHLCLHDILAIGSIPTRPIFESLHEYFGHPLIFFIFFFFFMVMSWRYTWDTTPSYSSRHTCHRLNSLMTILRITLWTTHWSILDLLHFLLIATLKPTYGSIIAYGQTLQVNLNANISLYGLSLITKTTHGSSMLFQSLPFW